MVSLCNSRCMVNLCNNNLYMVSLCNSNRCMVNLCNSRCMANLCSNRYMVNLCNSRCIIDLCRDNLCNNNLYMVSLCNSNLYMVSLYMVSLYMVNLCNSRCMANLCNSLCTVVSKINLFQVVFMVIEQVLIRVLCIILRLHRQQVVKFIHNSLKHLRIKLHSKHHKYSLNNNNLCSSSV